MGHSGTTELMWLLRRGLGLGQKQTQPLAHPILSARNLASRSESESSPWCWAAELQVLFAWLVDFLVLSFL